MFQKGDYIIYGNNGVCIVKDVGPLDIPGVPQDRIYYTLIPYYTKDSQIFIPADSDKVVMRPLIGRDEIMALINDIENIELLWIGDEKQREAKYKETMRKCDCRELIRIIKTITERKESRIAAGKKMTAADEKYFHLAEESLYGEFAIALGIEREQVADFIFSKVQKAKKSDAVSFTVHPGTLQPQQSP